MIKIVIPKPKLDRAAKLFSFSMLAVMFVLVAVAFFSLRASFDGLIEMLVSMP